MLRKLTAIGLCGMLAGPLGWGQQQASIAPQRPDHNVLIRPYLAPAVPPVRLGNGMRLRDLIRAGKLYLTAQDAIALALENNIDVETSRYNPLLAASALKRSQAGGPLPGVPSGASQVNTVTSGQGVAGTQQAAGVNVGGNVGAANGGNTTITQVGPVTPTLDPTFQSSQVFSHLSEPQFNTTQSQVENLISNKRNYSESIRTGYDLGGSVSLAFNNSYLNENSPVNFLNPSNIVSLQLSIQQNLLRAFGRAVNNRNITVAKANLHISDLNFQTQVVGVVVNVLNLYYGLVADYQDVKAKQGAVDVAQKFYEDNKKQVQIGTMAPLDVTTAEAQLATSQSDLVVSQTTLDQGQVALKNAISRNGLADPLLRDVEIVPLDRIDVPEKDNPPPMNDMLATAMANRPDIEADRLNLINAHTSALGTMNGLLPNAGVIGSATNNGTSGTPQIVPLGGASGIGAPGATLPTGIFPCPPGIGKPGQLCSTAPPALAGGVTNALGQMIRRNYPTERVAGFFNPTLRNRVAQADYGIEQLGLRQTELENRRTVNQVAVDVSNQSIALQQARARYQAAVRNRILQQQLLDAEQKRFALGASTSFLVVQQQRNLATAQSTEVAALVAYSNAHVALDQTLGLTLQANNISIEEAQSGQVKRQSTLPPTLP
ncbi:MAG TPA: TolC family protein [Bryobacteraceae bacterium]